MAVATGDGSHNGLVVKKDECPGWGQDGRDDDGPKFSRVDALKGRSPPSLGHMVKEVDSVKNLEPKHRQSQTSTKSSRYWSSVTSLFLMWVEWRAACCTYWKASAMSRRLGGFVVVKSL